MELDKRIIDGKKPLDCFDTEVAKQFIGKKGYFSNSLSWYSVLKSTWYGTLNEIESQQEECFLDSESDGYFQYFLPEEWVKEPEKKYRPFTIKEFEETFLKNELNSFIIFREKDEPNNVYTMRYNGNFISDNIEYICLGAKNIACASLFRYYEVANNDGEFVPFGIEE